MLARWVKLVHLPPANLSRNVNSLTSGSFVIFLQGQGRREKWRHAKRFMGTRIPRKRSSLCGLAGSLTIGSCAALNRPTECHMLLLLPPFLLLFIMEEKTRLLFPSCHDRNLCQSHVYSCLYILRVIKVKLHKVLSYYYVFFQRTFFIKNSNKKIRNRIWKQIATLRFQKCSPLEKNIYTSNIWTQ